MVAKCLPALFQFGMGVVSAGTRKYALVIKALELPLSLVGWSVTSLATFIPVSYFSSSIPFPKQLKLTMTV